MATLVKKSITKPLPEVKKPDAQFSFFENVWAVVRLIPKLKAVLPVTGLLQSIWARLNHRAWWVMP